MSAEIHIQTTVLPGNRIEVTAPDFSEGSVVDVVVMPHATSEPMTALEFRRLPIEEQRRRLAEMAEGMVEYYESTAAEREAWQGGDIIE